MDVLAADVFGPSAMGSASDEEAAEEAMAFPDVAGGLHYEQVRVVSTPEYEEATPLVPPRYGLANAVLARVTVFQSVAVNVAVGGVAIGDGPIVQGRELKLRLYVQGATGESILARVRWTHAGSTTMHLLAKRLSADSDDDDPESLFEFTIPAEEVTADAAIQVDLLVPDGFSFDVASPARFPQEGRSALEPVTGHRMKVVVVPMAYWFDGSGRTPDLAPPEVEALRAHLTAVYPIQDADIVVAPTRDYHASIGPDSFDDHVVALQQVMQWRSEEETADDVYYVGLVSPEDDFATYCRSGCYAGVAPRNEANVGYQRAGLVVWYGAEQSGWTTLHEIGHAHGRAHAPCGPVAGEDVDYPHAEGAVGVYGLDQRDGRVIAPSAHDFMSYCGDEWVSDYTYRALSERVQSVSSDADAFRLPAPSSPHRLLIKRAGGLLRWSTIEVPAQAASEDVELIRAFHRGGGSRLVEARRFHLSIDGDAWLVPLDENVWAYDVDEQWEP